MDSTIFVRETIKVLLSSIFRTSSQTPFSVVRFPSSTVLPQSLVLKMRSSSLLCRSVIAPAPPGDSDPENDSDKDEDNECSLTEVGSSTEVYDPTLHSKMLERLLKLIDKKCQERKMVPQVSTKCLKSGKYAKEDYHALYLITDMSGLGFDDVKVLVMKVENGSSVLSVIGHNKKEEPDRRAYCRTVTLDDGVFLLDEIKTLVKNGVVTVVVPKAKHEQVLGHLE